MQIGGGTTLQRDAPGGQLLHQRRVLCGTDAVAQALCSEGKGRADAFRPAGLSGVDGVGHVQLSGQGEQLFKIPGGEQRLGTRQIAGAHAPAQVFGGHADGLQILLPVAAAAHGAQDQPGGEPCAAQTRTGGGRHPVLVQAPFQMQLGGEADLRIKQALGLQLSAQVLHRQGDSLLGLQQRTGKGKFGQVLVQVTAVRLHPEPRQQRFLSWQRRSLHPGQLPDGSRGQGAIQVQMQVDQSSVMLFHPISS